MCVYMRDEVGVRPRRPAPPPAPTSPCGLARFPHWKTLPQTRLGNAWAAGSRAGVFPAPPPAPVCSAPPGAPEPPERFVLINICLAPCFDLFQN